MRHDGTIRGFTLVEMLVAVAIIAVLMGILIPSIRASKRQAQRVACQANLRSIGQLIHVYAIENDERIPRGPSYEPVDPNLVLTRPHIATSQIWTRAYEWVDSNGDTQMQSQGEYIGLGLLVKKTIVQDRTIADTTGNEFLFCPGDNKRNIIEELPRIGLPDKNAFSSYLYRQTDMLPPEIAQEGRIDNLGYNYGSIAVQTPFHDLGEEYRVDVFALAMDSNSLGTGDYRTTNHQADTVNVVYTDGSVSGYDNDKQPISENEWVQWGAIQQSAFVPFPSPDDIQAALDRILLAADYSRRTDPKPPIEAPVPPFPPYPP